MNLLLTYDRQKENISSNQIFKMHRAVSANHVISQALGAVRSVSAASTRSSKSRYTVVLGNNYAPRTQILASMRSCYAPMNNARQLQPQSQVTRMFSSDSSKKGSTADEGKKAEDGSEETQIVLTPGQKVVAYSRLSLWAVVFSFAAVCAFYIGRELFPTKMSPNRVFDNALDLIRNDSEITRRYGDSVKGYGRDHGGHREGRRNFIEHTERVDEEDGSKRVRVRFNIEGHHGNAFVFAEVSSDMPSGEFVYVLVQDKANGRVQTVVDNRAALTASRLSGGNKDSMAAMSQLLGGGKRN